MLQVWISMCTLVLTLGLDQAYIREYHSSQEKAQLLINTLVPPVFVSSIILALVLTSPGAMSKALFGIESNTLSALIACCTLAALLSRFLTLVLRMQERGLEFSLSQLTQKLLLLILIGSCLFFKSSGNFIYLVSSFTISYLVATIYSAISVSPELSKCLSKKPQAKEIQKLFIFGAPLIVGGAAFLGLTSADRIFLRHYSTFDELGVYSISLSFASIAVIFQSIFTTIWSPLVYKWASGENKLSGITYITDTLQAIVAIIFSLTALLSWILTYFLPKNYEQAQFLIITCMAFPLFYTLSEATAVGMGISRKTVHSMVATLISLALNMLCNYLLVPPLGATGAGISTAISFWAFLILRTELSIRVWRPIPRMRLYSISTICLCTAIAFSLYGPQHRILFTTLWCLILLLSLFLLIKSLPNTLGVLRTQPTKLGTNHATYE